MVYQANSKLKGIIDGFSKEYKVTADKSRENYMKVLPVGSRVPETGKIYQPEVEQEFNQRTLQYRAQANEILDNLLTDVHEKMTKAPTTDAANTVSLLSSRSNITRDEIDHLVETYGDNYQVYRAIQDIAHKSGYRIPDHYLGRQETELGDLKHNLDTTLRYETAAKHGDSFGAFCSFVETQVDQVVSD